jgi:hypothetical protein
MQTDVSIFWMNMLPPASKNTGSRFIQKGIYFLMYMTIKIHYTLIASTGNASRKFNIHYAVLLDLSKCCISTSLFSCITPNQMRCGD